MSEVNLGMSHAQRMQQKQQGLMQEMSRQMSALLQESSQVLQHPEELPQVELPTSALTTAEDQDKIRAWLRQPR